MTERFIRHSQRKAAIKVDKSEFNVPIVANRVLRVTEQLVSIASQVQRNREAKGGVLLDPALSGSLTHWHVLDVSRACRRRRFSLRTSSVELTSRLLGTELHDDLLNMLLASTIKHDFADSMGAIDFVCVERDLHLLVAFFD